jgi:HNH endonuclease
VAKRKTSGSSASTRVKIAKYWCDRETFINVRWEEPGCFACSKRSEGWSSRTLQAAHLIARADGGSTDPSNLVLLCARCHRDAPMVGQSASFMIDWINRAESYPSYAVRRIFEEVNAIDPKLIVRVVRSAWAPQGNTFDARNADFIRKMDMMANFLGINFAGGGEIFATAAAILAAMGDLPLPLASPDFAPER